MTGKKTGAPPAAALVRPVATGILIGSAFLLIFLFALHKPAPDGVPVGVVGPVSGVAPAGQRVAAGYRLKRTDDQIYEYACHEGNRAMVGILAGARLEEKKAAEVAAAKK